MSSVGVPLDFDATLVTQTTDALDLVKRFGPKWYENNIYSEVLSYVRDEVKKHGMNETAIATTAAAEIDSNVSTRIEAYLKANRFPVRLVRFTLGKANPPDSIKDQRVATAASQQKVQTLKQEVLAEEQRAISEAKRAAADRAYQQGLGLTSDQYMEKLKLDTLKEVCGDNNCTFIQQGTPLIVNK
jgi:regulator of protease activity HflC (stomatin/prohibitin superfamily)